MIFLYKSLTGTDQTGWKEEKRGKGVCVHKKTKHPHDDNFEQNLKFFNLPQFLLKGLNFQPPLASAFATFCSA
ncbi:unnamed protein product [Allacma fusca]|uniref:Uncharacterized protein n=1 Tax=Allacma fusca TaxID=39272 RepID=A0A8J2LF00_9HEXA|nr:unnamed protein product [Allacma fusca]